VKSSRSVPLPFGDAFILISVRAEHFACFHIRVSYACIFFGIFGSSFLGALFFGTGTQASVSYSVCEPSWTGMYRYGQDMCMCMMEKPGAWMRCVWSKGPESRDDRIE
jgi:hypothetical protein